MAGYLPDVSGIRFPFATDGTLVQAGNSTSGYGSVAANNVAAMANGETSSSFTYALSEQKYLSFLFPQARDLNGVSMKWNSSGGNCFIVGVDISTDTTDGINGTWEEGVIYNGGGALPGKGLSSTWIRQNPFIVARTNVVGLRLRIFSNGGYSIYFYSVDLFGSYSYAGLSFWHPNLDQPIGGAYFDLGDVIQGQQFTKQFRIKNTASQDAMDIVISSSSGFGAMGSGLTFSNDGVNYSSTVNISSLATNTISAVHYVKRTVGVGETTAVANLGSIRAVATNWVG